jgi:hypothetical protein
MASCPAFWLEQPRVLVDQATEFFPFTERDKRCTASALNSFTRFGIYLGVILAAVRLEWRWLLVGAVFAGFSVLAWYYMSGRGSVREGFLGFLFGADTEGFDGGYAERIVENPTEHDVVTGAQVGGRYIPDVIGEQGRTNPTAANPFMNILISEISDNPYRKPAADVQGVAVRAELDDYFNTMFARDPGDVFNRTQSQRQWVTMPSTTVPNDQESFANWLYRAPGRTYKEGNGARGNVATDGHYPWREIGPVT